MNIIDTETIHTDAGDYTVKFIVDEDGSQPEDEGFALITVGAPHKIDIDTTKGAPFQVYAILQISAQLGRGNYWNYEYRSGAALVRWLTLTGHQGVTLVDADYNPVEATTDRFERVYGVAWAPEDVPAAMADQYVLNRLKEWKSWAEGDMFFYEIEDPNGVVINEDERYTFYGYYDQADDLLQSEIMPEIHADAAERINSVNRVGAGFVGLI